MTSSTPTTLFVALLVIFGSCMDQSAGSDDLEESTGPSFEWVPVTETTPIDEFPSSTENFPAAPEVDQSGQILDQPINLVLSAREIYAQPLPDPEARHQSPPTYLPHQHTYRPTLPVPEGYPSLQDAYQKPAPVYAPVYAPASTGSHDVAPEFAQKSTARAYASDAPVLCKWGIQTYGCDDPFDNQVFAAWPEFGSKPIDQSW